jgi:hypothetical protein
MARLNHGAILKEFRARASLAGLNMRYEAELKVPYAQRTATGATIVLPIPDPTWDEDKWADWEFSAEHELGHVMPACMDAYDVLDENGISTSSFLGAMLNITEDHRQEWTAFNEFAGRKLRLSKGRRLFWDNFDTTPLGDVKADKHRLAMETQFVWDNMIREEWMHSLLGTSEKLIAALNDEQIMWLDKLKAGDYESTLKSGISAAQEYDLVKRIIEEVYGFDAEEEEENAQQQGSGSSAEEGEEGDGGADGQGTERGEGDNASSSESEFGEGDQEGKARAATVNYADLMAHNHEDTTSDSRVSYAPLTIIYDDVEYGSWEPFDPDTFKLYDFTSITPEGSRNNYREHLDTEHGRGLAKHVRRLLQVRSQSRYEHGMKRGRVSPKSIYRGALQGPASQRVFKKRFDSDVLDTAVYLLCDSSGSMGGWGEDAKIVNAGISIRLLNDAISSIGIPLEVAMFDYHNTPRHALVKNFTQRVDGGILMDRFAAGIDRLMGSNTDGESILWAYERLMRRKEKRKVMIVLSDGQPAGGSGDIKTYTKTVIEEIEKRNQIDLYAIGIMTESVKRFYKNSVVIQRADQLESALLNVIEKRILD